MPINKHGYIGWERGRKKPEARSIPPIINFLGYNPWPADGTLDNRLRARRRSLGLTQRRPAAELGIEEGTFRRRECDGWTPKGERLIRIRNWLASLGIAAEASAAK